MAKERSTSTITDPSTAGIYFDGHNSALDPIRIDPSTLELSQKSVVTKAAGNATVDDADIGKHVVVESNAAAQTVTLPDIETVDIGKGVTVYNKGSDDMTLTAGGADTILGDATVSVNEFVELFVSADDEWIAGGGGGGLANVVEDTTPQAGGDYDLQTFKLVGNGGTEGIEIASDGDVAIGHSSPQGRLDMETASGVCSMIMNRNQTMSEDQVGARLNFMHNNASVARIDTVAVGAGSNGTAIAFFTQPDGGGGLVERLRIQDVGGTEIYGILSRSTTAGITASGTQSQGQQALTTDINEVSTVTIASDVVTLPAASAGREITVINNGANTLQIYPASGDDLGGGVDASTTLAAGVNVTFTAYDATNWIVKQ